MAEFTPNSQQRIDKNSLPFIVVVVLILGILLGYLSTTILNSAKLLANDASLNSNLSSSGFFDENYLDNVYKTLNDTYLGDLPNKTAITQGMVKGIISSLKDPYTAYLTPEEAAAYNTAKDPDFEGIGVSLKFDGENTQVESVLDGNPALSAGLKAGDVIAFVDGVSVIGQYPTQVSTKIRGPKGSIVDLKIYRKDKNGQNQLKEFKITRAKINIDNVSYKNLGGGIFKINITQFTDSSAEALNRSWDKIVSEMVAENPDPKGIVIDLRNNPGGYVFSLRYILEDFFKTGSVLMQEEKKNMETIVYKDERVGKFEDVPISVIVNEGSASASEIFASAVQDHKRGSVIGTKTVGKGVEQTLITQGDSSLLILVFQKWLTPSGNNISKDKPITPDYLVDLTDADIKAVKDPQLDKALELLK